MKLHTHHRLTDWISSTMARLSVRFAGQQPATSGALQLKPYGLHAVHPLRQIRAFAGPALMTTGLALACLTAIVPPAQARGGVVNPNAITVGPATPAGSPAPFDITGAIQSFSALSANNVYSGGTIMVNGISVMIPANLVVTLPAAYMTVGQLFGASPQSGLALLDVSAPIAAYEATISGNIVGGVYIAGLVSIAQQSANTANGYIRSINYATGELCVGSTPGTPGTPCALTDARVVINDPDGRYGLANGVGGKAKPDARFTVDADNPTIHARSGYPMCVPRVAPPLIDDKCPMANRPKDTLGAFMPLYVMDSNAMTAPAQFVGLVIPPCPLPFSCNVNEQAPLVVGDYITYSGILAKDAVGVGIYVAAYSLEANVGIYTRSGGTPFYMYMDAPLISTGPAACPANAECQARLKTSIFVTDPFRTPAMYAVDETLAGVRTSRQLPSTLTNTAVLGRFVFVTDKDTRVLGGVNGVTREIMGRAANLGDGGIVSYGPPPVSAKLGTANGLVAGQYVSPVGSYIFPEPNIAGGILTPYNFRCLAFLAKGWGQGGALTGIGQLIPFPEAVAPAPATVNCTF